MNQHWKRGCPFPIVMDFKAKPTAQSCATNQQKYAQIVLKRFVDNSFTEMSSSQVRMPNWSFIAQHLFRTISKYTLSPLRTTHMAVPLQTDRFFFFFSQNKWVLHICSIAMKCFVCARVSFPIVVQFRFWIAFFLGSLKLNYWHAL